MLRAKVAERGLGAGETFRWRGGEITRLEGFSDGVFAFAVTLLVVSLEVPRTFDQLLETMRGFVAFAICFLLLLFVWYGHYTFFRRYGLQTTAIAVLNGILLFLVLFYVYPLKFLFTLVVDQLMGRGETVALASGSVAPRIGPDQAPLLLTIYGAGYLAISLTFALLYAYAYRARASLGLDRAETLATWAGIERYLLMGGVGVLSILVALLGGPDHTTLAGFTYLLLWLVLTPHGMARGRQVRRERDTAPDVPVDSD